MNKFLKDLMKLATELNQANGFEAVVVFNEMELLYDKHVAELKNLAIPDVSKQRELLIAFACKLNNVSIDQYRTYYGTKVDEFLKSN